jgi:hypothetical protein
MKKALRRTLKISGIALGAVVVLALAAALLVVFDKPLIKNIVRKQLAKGAGSTARIGRLDYAFSPFRVTVDSLELGREDAFQKLTVSLTRLEARGSFWKLMRGAKPALDAIEADGVSLRVEQKALSKEPMDPEKVLIQAADMLAWSKRIAITRARISMSLLAQDADIENFDLTLTPGPAPDVVAYSIGRGDLTFKSKDGAVRLSTGLISSGSLGLVSPFIVDASLTLGAPRFSFSGIEDSFESASLVLAGRFDKSANQLDLSRLKLGIPGLLDLEGSARGRIGHSLFLEAEAGARLESLAAAAALLGPRLPAGLRAAALGGRADVAGKYTLQRTDQGSTDNLSGTLQLEGLELSPAVGGRPLRVRASGRIDASGPSNDPRLAADVRASLGRVTAAGLTVLSSDVHVVGSGSRSSADISRLDARLAGLAFGASAGTGMSFDTATLTAKGTVDVAGKSGVLTSLDARLAGLAFEAAEGKRIAFDNASLTAKGTVDVAGKSGALTALEARLAGLVFEVAEGKKIALDSASLTANGTFDLARKGGVLTSLEARLPGLAPLRLAGRYSSGKNASSELRVEARGLDIPALRAIAAPFIPEGFAGWDLGGTLDLSLSARRPASSGDELGFSAMISLAGAKFNDPTFSVAGESLDPVVKIEGAGSASKGLAFNASLDIGQGESLWKSVYIAWSKHPLKLTAAGRYDPGSGGLDGLAARVLLPEVGSIDITGSAKLGPAPSFDLATETRLSLGPLYSLYTQTGVPEEARMLLEGTLGATLRVRQNGEALSVGGRVRLADTNMERPQAKTLLLGVTADLPVLYESRPSGASTPVEAPLTEEGRLHIGEIQNAFLTVKPVDITLRAGVNALGLEPVSLELFGGRVELGRTVFRLDPASASFAGVGSLALRDIDIAKFPVQSPQFKLTGKIQAEFPRLDFSRDRIAIAGRGEASVFGGKIVLRDLSVAEPFDPGRSISLNVDIVELDLKKLTDEVPFGEVTGIVSGEVRDLVITYNQPESFYFRIESVPRKGVPRTFSLKAVDNLTVLSSGQQASGGTGNFWMSFIRGFRYKKLGIVSTLRNDTFTLSGTIKENGIEYLVKKPALFGITVVNREPGKSISFKEMTSRLKRVGQSEK